MSTPNSWLTYDAEWLARIGAPDDAIAALARRGLPGDAYGWFVRVPTRELEVAELPECGRAAFLAEAIDGFWNSYWLSLADGSIWMRYGKRDEPVHHVKRINTSVHTLQEILGVWIDYKGSNVSPESDEAAYENLVYKTLIRVVSLDPEVFMDEETWWARTFEEVGYTIPRVSLGDRPLYQYVRQDESGQWVLDHPGFEEEG
jgi:hypothetical protein